MCLGLREYAHVWGIIAQGYLVSVSQWACFYGYLLSRFASSNFSYSFRYQIFKAYKNSFQSKSIVSLVGVRGTECDYMCADKSYILDYYEPYRLICL